MHRGSNGSAATLKHPAFAYRSVDEFLDSLGPFVLEGVERGEPVFAAVGPDELDALRDEVGPRPGVRLEDTRAWEPNPATRLRAFHEYVLEEIASGTQRIRLVGEPVWPDGPEPFVREWARYESVLNTILAPFPVELVCTYPVSRLDPAIVADSARTHPALRTGRHTRTSDDFAEPEELLVRWNPPLGSPPSHAAVMGERLDLAEARRFVADRAIAAGVPSGRVPEVTLAASEILANARIHGSPPARLTTWSEPGFFLCQVDDQGSGPGDALAGYRPPTASQGSGRGLWLARQLADLLQIVPGRRGTSVRLHIGVAA